MVSKQLKAGIKRPESRKYPVDVVARIRRAYLTHRVLAYLPLKAVLGELSREFGVDAEKLRGLLTYEGLM